jgi:hypothetical protein
MSSRIHTIQLEEYDEKHAPPERVLEMALVGDCLHLDIATYSETHESSEIERVETFAVDVASFKHALRALILDQRDQNRKKDVEFKDRHA